MSSQQRLRAATLADAPAVAALISGMGFRPRSAAAWRWLFEENPARAEYDVPPDIGWVLEDGDALLGYLGNVPLSYMLDGKPVRAASCTDYYALPAAGAGGAGLLRAFFRQCGVDVFLTTTANARTAPMYEMFDSVAPPDASLSEEYVWVAHDSIALREMLAKRGLPPVFAGAVGALVGPVSAQVRALVGFSTVPKAVPAAEITELGPEDIDQRFERLWQGAASSPGLRVRRDSRGVQWYLSNPDAGAVPTVFAAVEGGEIVGYAAVAANRTADAQIGRLSVLDVLTLPGRERVIPALLERTVMHARKMQLGFVYARPCGISLAPHFRALQPRVQRFDQPMFYFRAADRHRTAELARPGLWDATGLDGDAPLCMDYGPG